MKLNPVQKSGQAQVKMTVKETGNNPRVIKNEESTVLFGPFDVGEKHAEARCGLRVTLSENYNSVSMECSVMVPTPNTEEGINEGFDWAKRFCEKKINEGMKDVRAALKGRG